MHTEKVSTKLALLFLIVSDTSKFIELYLFKSLQDKQLDSMKIQHTGAVKFRRIESKNFKVSLISS